MRKNKQTIKPVKNNISPKKKWKKELLDPFALIFYSPVIIILIISIAYLIYSLCIHTEWYPTLRIGRGVRIINLN